MKCIKCNTDNITKANYCKNCCYKFSKREQKIARGKTFIGKLENLEEAYKICNLKKVLSNKITKIVSFVALLTVGISNLNMYGDSTKILNSLDYNLEYNEKSNEYYIFTDNDKVNLDMYIPNSIESLNIKRMEKDYIIDEYEFKREDDITLYANKETDYYLIKSDSNDESLYDDMIVYIYKGDKK